LFGQTDFGLNYTPIICYGATGSKRENKRSHPRRVVEKRVLGLLRIRHAIPGLSPAPEIGMKVAQILFLMSLYKRSEGQKKFGISTPKFVQNQLHSIALPIEGPSWLYSALPI